MFHSRTRFVDNLDGELGAAVDHGRHGHGIKVARQPCDPQGAVGGRGQLEEIQCQRT